MCLDIQDKIPTAIHHIGIVDGCDTFRGIFKNSMGMTVKKIPGLISVYKSSEYLKPPMADIFGIVDMPGGSMGDDNIDSPVPPQQRTDFSDQTFHFLFSVLHGATVVPPGAFKTHNPEILEM